MAAVIAMPRCRCRTSNALGAFFIGPVCFWRRPAAKTMTAETKYAVDRTVFLFDGAR
jgi:hypothetical protein